MRRVSLLEHTLTLVENRPRTLTYKDIQKKTGIPVSYLQNLMSGLIKDPGVNRIEKLYIFFTKKPLQFS